MGPLKDRAFLSSMSGHLGVDLLNGLRPMLLVVLSIPLGLSNAAIGLISTIYVLAASLSQPVFGMISDRIGPRWVAAGGILWMCTFFSLALVQPGNASLILLVLASLGSAAFHPAGTAEATGRARTHFAEAETTVTSFFFFSGAAGYSIGPMIGGPILDRWGPSGLMVLAFIVAPASIAAGRYLGLSTGEARVPGQPNNHIVPAAGKGLLIPLILLTGFRSWAQSNMTAFIPKFHSDLGASASTYGLIAGFFMGGSALGGGRGRKQTNHFGKRKVTFWTLLLSALPLALYPVVGRNGWAYLLAPVAGGLTGASNSISIVLAQQIIPGKAGTTSGLALGFIFTAGALGTWLSGIQADASGFQVMFWTTAALCLAGALASLMMRSD